MKIPRKARRDARRLFRACLKGGRLDEACVRQAAVRVAKAGRRGTLAVLSHFHRLVTLELSRRRAIVESATPLPSDFRDRIQSDLTRTYGPGTTTTFEENPALIAGMRVKVGSDVYDGSVRTALAALEQRFR
jgi:F-type H+-transporting ATPase subunit delta